MDEAILKIAEMYDGYGTALFTLITTIISGLLAGIIGFEREIRGQSAGLRTHVLLAVGSSLLMSISIFAIQMTGATFDASRIAAGVVSGIGFLCAGCIIKTGANIRGLTTSATLWICGGIGLAVGSGFVLEAIVATGVTLLFLIGLVYLERLIDKKSPLITVVADENVPVLSIIHKRSDEFNLVIKAIDSERGVDELGRNIITVSVRFAYTSKELPMRELIESLSLTDNIYHVTSNKYDLIGKGHDDESK